MEHLPSFERGEFLGTYLWNPSAVRVRGTKDFKDVTAEEVLQGLCQTSETPPRLIEIRRLQLPLRFRDLPPQRCLNKFPHDAGYIVPLHMAMRSGVDLSTVDFCLGGSSLNMLATQEIDRREPGLKYVAQRVPGTQVIVLCKSHAYVTDYADVGFQFERLLTGGRMEDQHDPKTFESLQLRKIGGFTVLFSAEVDAVDSRGEPVEIKSGNPRNFGMKVMFQMLSSGAGQLVSADRQGKDLRAVRTQTLREMILQHPPAKLRQADGNIVEALHFLKASRELEAGLTMELDFARGRLALLPCEGGDVLPSPEVVADLLSP